MSQSDTSLNSIHSYNSWNPAHISAISGSFEIFQEIDVESLVILQAVYTEVWH